MDYNIYISKSGSDSSSGTLQSPVKSIDEAKKRVKEIKEGNINVFFRGGTYQVNHTIHFGVEDGGNSKKRINYSAYKDEKPVFTSAVKITGFKKVEYNLEDLPSIAKGRIYEAPFPEGIDKIYTLFNGKEPLERCHSKITMPTKNYEYERTDSLNVAKEEDRYLLRKIDFEKGLIKNRSNISDIEMRLRPVPWTMNLLPLSNVDEENNVATLAVEMTAPICAKSCGMMVENDIMYMTQEGFFCTDSQKRKIYYFGNPEGMDIWTPTVKTFFKIEGNIDYNGMNDTPVKNLHFNGLEFYGGMRDTNDKDYKGWGIQHDWEMFDKDNSLIRFRGGENCSITNCYFHSTSATALRLDLYCQNILVKNNMFDNIGNMGILLCGYGCGIKDVNKNNIITNNILTRCGQEIWHGHCIFVWQSGSNLISHNTIHDSARKAIGLCGTRITILKNPSHKFDEASKTIRWKEIQSTFKNSDDEYENFLPYLHSKNNIVEFNNIYQVLQKLGDGAAVNISGAGENNIINNNYVHHISTYLSSSVMRVDDWQRGTTFQNNVIYKSNISGIIRKNLNHIINNYIVDVNCKNGYIKFASYPDEKPGYGSKIINNILYESGDEMKIFGSGYLVSAGATLPENCNIKNNLYYCRSNPHSLTAQIKQNDNNSLIADPMFKDIQSQNFTMSPDSPAFKLGIRQIDISDCGVTKDYPAYLKSYEYFAVDNDLYERGKNESKKDYSWW